MGTRENLIQQARLNGGWVSRPSRHELDAALMGILYFGDDVHDLVALENMRRTRESVLAEMEPISRGDVPAEVLAELGNKAVKTNRQEPDKTVIWRCGSHEYELHVSPPNERHQWFRRRFVSSNRSGRPPDYAGHFTAPTELSLKVVRAIAERLSMREVVSTLAAIGIDAAAPTVLLSRAASSWICEADEIARRLVAKGIVPEDISKQRLADRVHKEMSAQYRSTNNTNLTKRGQRKLPAATTIARSGLPGFGTYTRKK